MELTVIAIDIAKKVFQLHWVEPETGVIERLKLKRAQLLPWMANRQPAAVMMEACGGAHEWGRQFFKLGQDVRLLPPKTVRRSCNATRPTLQMRMRSGPPANSQLRSSSL